MQLVTKRPLGRLWPLLCRRPAGQRRWRTRRARRHFTRPSTRRRSSGRAAPPLPSCGPSSSSPATRIAQSFAKPSESQQGGEGAAKAKATATIASRHHDRTDVASRLPPFGELQYYKCFFFLCFQSSVAHAFVLRETLAVFFSRQFFYLRGNSGRGRGRVGSGTNKRRNERANAAVFPRSPDGRFPPLRFPRPRLAPLSSLGAGVSESDTPSGSSL